MVSNQAAWLVGLNKPLEVGDSEMPKPAADEVVVRNRAVAINPVDWKNQEGHYLNEISLPFVVGTDVAGEIHEMGSAVKGFKKGERVLAHCTGLWDKKPQSGAYQLYTAANSNLISKIPADMSFTDASVLPLALSTAAAGLYAEDNLNLPPPNVAPKPANKAILIWGGSSSVGAVAIQLAKASGLAVITTASSHNLSSLKSQLGADYVFDHKDAAVVDDVVGAVGQLKADGHEFAGVYDAISLPVSFKAIGQVFDKLGSSNLVSEKKLAIVLPASDLPSDVQAQFLIAPSLLGPHKGVADAVWAKFVPEALEKAVLKPLPPPLVVGKGLESLQKGVYANKKGVSYAKVVVEL